MTLYTCLETERLYLKVLDETYADKVLMYNLKNKDFLSEWEPLKDSNYYTIDYTRKLLVDEQTSMKNGLMYKFYLFKKTDLEERVIGLVAFNNIIRGCFQSCFLGYKLDVDEINQGFMTEALSVAIDFAFNELKLHRIEANIMPKNIRSLRVVEKLGFCNEGLALKYLKINGKWEDHIHMVLFNEKME